MKYGDEEEETKSESNNGLPTFTLLQLNFQCHNEHNIAYRVSDLLIQIIEIMDITYTEEQNYTLILSSVSKCPNLHPSSHRFRNHKA